MDNKEIEKDLTVENIDTEKTETTETVENKNNLNIMMVLSVLLVFVIGSLVGAIILVSIEQRIGYESTKVAVEIDEDIVSYIGVYNKQKVYYSHTSNILYYTDGNDLMDVTGEPIEIGQLIRDKKIYNIYFNGYTLGIAKEAKKVDNSSDYNELISPKELEGASLYGDDSTWFKEINNSKLTPSTMKVKDVIGEIYYINLQSILST